MGKRIPDAILDLMLDQAEGTQIHICSAEPTSYAEASSTYELAGAAMTGSYTAAAGDVSGRKNTVPAQTGIPIGSSGTANHVAITNGTDTLLKVTTCGAQALTAGGTVDTNAFDHEIQDPA